MRRLCLAVVLGAAVAGAAHADTDVRTLADSCAICHGTDGKPPRDGLDRLAGMRSSEFVEEMRELRDDPDEGRLMSVIARGYSDAEIRAMADYFAKLR